MIEELLALRPGLRLSVGDDATPSSIDLGQAVLPLGVRAKGARAALELLAAGATEDDVVGTVMDVDGEEAVLGFQILLRRLLTGGLLARRVRCDGRDLYASVPTAFRAPEARAAAGPGTRWVLTRFTTIAPTGDGTVCVANPLSAVRLVLHEPRLAAVVAALARPATMAEVAGTDEVEGVLNLLDDVVRGGFVDDADGVESHALALWSPEDLAFHRRSRLGYHTGGYGGTYRLDGTVPPAPGRRPDKPLAVAFAASDLDEVTRRDPPLTTAMERRRSRRDHDDGRPITSSQLGEILYRTVRVTQRMADEHEDLLFRPVPAGGALHAIDVYPAVRLCDGLAPGLYRYDGDLHGLVSVHEGQAGVDPLMATVPLQPGCDARPQVLLVFSARFARAMWKYESMAYALVLKDLGVLFQSIYLVATAMGLAPCAQGGGDSEVFCRLAGLDPLEESSVGEFALGSVAAGEAEGREGAPGGGQSTVVAETP